MYLQNCDLTGCELQHANLRGSNLTGAILKEIVAPLHMSQTVNVTTVSSQADGMTQQAPPPSLLAAGQGHASQHVPPPVQVQQLPQQPHQRHNQPGASPPHVQLPGGGDGIGVDGAAGGMGNGISDRHTGSAQEQGSHDHSNT